MGGELDTTVLSSAAQYVVTGRLRPDVILLVVARSGTR
jgi:hypothetical protein